MQRKIKRITTGDLQRELMRFFPQLTEDMVRRDAEKNVLPTYPRFGQQSWYYNLPKFYYDPKTQTTWGSNQFGLS